MDYSFHNTASPTIEIEVFGWNSDLRHRVTAIVDTGFTGFLLLPIIDAFVVGPILDSTMDITLADGTLQSRLVCMGGIHFNSQTQPGLILIEYYGTEALIGMEFLKAFNLILTLDATNSTLRLDSSTASTTT